MTARLMMRAWLGLAVSAGLMLALLGPVVAQEGEPLPDPLEPIPRDEVGSSFPIDDGTYTGIVSLGGSFRFSDQGVTVVWAGSSSGPLRFDVVDGELTGEWSVEGAADITGYGLPFEMAGTNSWTMNGTVSGTDPYIMEGSGSGVSSVSAAGQTSRSTYPIPTRSAPWEGVMQLCGQVMGSWDQAIDAAFEGAPLQHALRSYFTVFSTDFATELDERITRLVEDATRLARDPSQDEIILLGDLAVLLLEAEEILEAIEAQPDGCPADPGFMRIITQVVQDLMNTFLGRWSQEDPDAFQMVALRRLVEVALRAGAIGAGALDSGVGSFLETRAEQVLQSQFDAVVAADPMSDFDVTQVAVTATLLGYTFDSGITGQDICLVVDTC